MRGLYKDVGLCPSTLLCSSIRRVINHNLSLLIFHCEKQFENLWCGQDKRLFCKSSIVFANLIHIMVPVAGARPTKIYLNMCLTANHWGDPTDFNSFEGVDSFLLK